MTASLEHPYQSGHPVWALLDGFPWWPARVVKPHELWLGPDETAPQPRPNEVLVEFFNDDKRFACLSSSKVRPFSDRNPPISASTPLIEAVNECHQYIHDSRWSAPRVVCDAVLTPASDSDADAPAPVHAPEEEEEPRPKTELDVITPGTNTSRSQRSKLSTPPRRGRPRGRARGRTGRARSLPQDAPLHIPPRPRKRLRDQDNQRQSHRTDNHYRGQGNQRQSHPSDDHEHQELHDDAHEHQHERNYDRQSRWHQHAVPEAKEEDLSQTTNEIHQVLVERVPGDEPVPRDEPEQASPVERASSREDCDIVAEQVLGQNSPPQVMDLVTEDTNAEEHVQANRTENGEGSERGRVSHGEVGSAARGGPVAAGSGRPNVVEDNGASAHGVRDDECTRDGEVYQILTKDQVISLLVARERENRIFYHQNQLLRKQLAELESSEIVGKAKKLRSLLKPAVEAIEGFLDPKRKKNGGADGRTQGTG